MTEKFKIVVNGATGFVAKNMRKYLSENNLNVVSISRKNFRTFKNEIKIISKDYDEKLLLPHIKNHDALIHLVGIGKESVYFDYHKVNVEFTKHMINLCKKANIKKIVYLSGLGVSPKTSLGYFISKYKAERLIVDSQLDYTIFRPSYIVGKDDLLTKYLKDCIKKQKITIPGSGKYTIQPIHISDAVRVFYKSILSKKFQNKIIDLVGPDKITFEKYVKLFSMGSKTQFYKLDLEYAYRQAIVNPKFSFGVDDLNILVGSFEGNPSLLNKTSGMSTLSVLRLLKTGTLF